MDAPPLRCPFCSSDKIYSLMGTLHCKRCKGMWPGDRKDPVGAVPARPPGPADLPPLRIRARTESLETRMEKKLDDCLRKYNGRICLEALPRTYYDIPDELFRKFVKNRIAGGVLRKTQDRYGRTWYRRHEE